MAGLFSPFAIRVAHLRAILRAAYGPPRSQAAARAGDPLAAVRPDPVGPAPGAVPGGAGPPARPPAHRPAAAPPEPRPAAGRPDHDPGPAQRAVAPPAD